MRKKLILLGFLVLSFLGKAEITQNQTNNSWFKNEKKVLTKKEKRKQIPSYIGIGFGTNNSKFRDFATSPLFYEGGATQISLSYLKMGNSRESEFGFSYDFGTYSSKFNKNTTESAVKRIELYYSRLYKIKLFNSESINTKVGFLLNGNGNLRVNEGLHNNATGVDIFGNLSGSVKIAKDIKLYRNDERKRNLAFGLNLGLINSSFRNGYAYSGQAPILNKIDIFDDYKFKIFSGFRAGTKLDYTRYLKNKNAIQFSYIWDAYSTGGNSNKFEMAHHILKLTLFFNTNNK